jgi:hypothetical protein
MSRSKHEQRPKSWKMNLYPSSCDRNRGTQFSCIIMKVSDDYSMCQCNITISWQYLNTNMLWHSSFYTIYSSCVYLK